MDAALFEVSDLTNNFGGVQAVSHLSFNVRRGQLKAISVSETAAGTLGINPAKYLLQVYVLGAAFASIAGSLLVHRVRGAEW